MVDCLKLIGFMILMRNEDTDNKRNELGIRSFNMIVLILCLYECSFASTGKIDFGLELIDIFVVDVLVLDICEVSMIDTCIWILLVD